MDDHPDAPPGTRWARLRWDGAQPHPQMEEVQDMAHHLLEELRRLGGDTSRVTLTAEPKPEGNCYVITATAPPLETT